MDHMQTIRTEISKLSREDVESLVMGLSTMVSMTPEAIMATQLIASITPENFKGTTLDDVKLTLEFMGRVSDKIGRNIQESN